MTPVHPHPQNGKEKSGIQKRSCHKQVAIVDGLEEQRSSLYEQPQTRGTGNEEKRNRSGREFVNGTNQDRKYGVYGEAP